MDGSTHGRAVRAAMITSSGFRVVADGIIYTGVTGFAGAKLSSVLCRTSIDSSRSGTDKFVGDVSTVLALMVDFGRTIHDEYFLFFLRFLFVRIFLPTRTRYANPGSSVGNHFLINGLFIQYGEGNTFFVFQVQKDVVFCDMGFPCSRVAHSVSVQFCGKNEIFQYGFSNR